MNRPGVQLRKSAQQPKSVLPTLEYGATNNTIAFEGGIAMDDLTNRQLQEYLDERKSLSAAYILWGMLGPFGAHRFYLEKTGSAVAMLILTLTVIGIIVTLIWWIVDAVLTVGMVKDMNKEILYDITG